MTPSLRDQVAAGIHNELCVVPGLGSLCYPNAHLEEADAALKVVAEYLRSHEARVIQNRSARPDAVLLDLSDEMDRQRGEDRYDPADALTKEAEG